MLRMPKRVLQKIVRIIRGQSFVWIYQDKEKWEQQFAKGTWDRIRDGGPHVDAVVAIVRARSLELRRPLSVLDVGCGNGGIARSFLGDDTISRYVGIDISQRAVKEASEQNPEGTYFAHNIDDGLPEGIGTFDIVICSEVLYYINAPKCIRTLNQALESHSRAIYSYYRSWRGPIMRALLSLMTHVVDVRMVYNKARTQSWTIVVTEKRT